MHPPPTADPVVFALALLRLDGVGRVTTHRLIASFPTWERLLTTPREQVLVRLKGVPRAAATVSTLFDEAVFHPVLDEAAAERDALAERRIGVLAPGVSAWPLRLNALPLARRPVVLYTYGQAALLQKPLLAVMNRPPLNKAVLELAEDVARAATQHDVYLATGLATGFDSVMNKLSAAAPHPLPTVLVAHCGLGRIPNTMRALASGMVKRGSLMVSPFPLQHGPFDHDDQERANVQAALAGASMFFAPRPDTHEWHAMEWTQGAKRPAFAAMEDDAIKLPEGVVEVKSSVDFQWVFQAARATL